jgi:hypothetical protein
MYALSSESFHAASQIISLPCSPYSAYPEPVTLIILTSVVKTKCYVFCLLILCSKKSRCPCIRAESVDRIHIEIARTHARQKVFHPSYMSPSSGQLSIIDYFSKYPLCQSSQNKRIFRISVESSQIPC